MVEWYVSNIPFKRYVGQQERSAGMKMVKLQFIALDGTQDEWERLCVSGWNSPDPEVKKRCLGSILQFVKEIPFLRKGKLPDEMYKAPVLSPEEGRRLVDGLLKGVVKKIPEARQPLNEQRAHFYLGGRK